MKKKSIFSLILFGMLFINGCIQLKQVIHPITTLTSPLPEEITHYPEINSYGRSRVGVFRFDDLPYMNGTGVEAADKVYNCLLKKRVFGSVINEITEEKSTLSEKLEIARSKGYDLLITGAVLHYFEGGEFMPSQVNEQITVIHLPTNRILWLATAEETNAPTPAMDYRFFQTRGTPALPAPTLFQKNALKFSYMLRNKPVQNDSLENPTDIYFRSQKMAMDDLEAQNNLMKTEKIFLEQHLFKACEKSEQLSKRVDTLSAQATQLEQQLKEEIERGEITLKRYKNKTIINIDNRICFDSGSDVLKGTARQTLGKIALTLNDFPGHNIQIQGHTDNVPIRGRGRFADNWELSSARSLSVLSYLLKQSNLDPGKLSAAGFGEYHPILPNDTKENKRLNRRVDIVIIPDDVDLDQKATLKKSGTSEARS